MQNKKIKTIRNTVSPSISLQWIFCLLLFCSRSAIYPGRSTKQLPLGVKQKNMRMGNISKTISIDFFIHSIFFPKNLVRNIGINRSNSNEIPVRGEWGKLLQVVTEMYPGNVNLRKILENSVDQIGQWCGSQSLRKLSIFYSEIKTRIQNIKLTTYSRLSFQSI